VRDSGILTGWKEIAKFIGVTVKTAPRYLFDGLPVTCTSSGRVFSTKMLLAEWIHKNKGGIENG
jgi:hypothetical protein